MNNRTASSRVLAIAPSSRGYGYAILEEPFKLVDWGVKTVSGDWRTQALAKVSEMVEHYEPHLLALPEISEGHDRRSKRAQLILDVAEFAKPRKLSVQFASKEDVIEFFFAGRPATKHELAVLLSVHFPDELGTLTPPKREAWMSEDYRMVIFTAVSLALTIRWKKTGVPFRETAK
jgi:hypothetical protein